MPVEIFRINMVHEGMKFYLIPLLGCQSNVVKFSIAIPLPNARIMSLDKVVGAWNEARQATMASLIRPRYNGVWRTFRIADDPKK